MLGHGPKTYLRQLLGVSATTAVFNPQMVCPTEKMGKTKEWGKETKVTIIFLVQVHTRKE